MVWAACPNPDCTQYEIAKNLWDYSVDEMACGTCQTKPLVEAPEPRS